MTAKSSGTTLIVAGLAVALNLVGATQAIGGGDFWGRPTQGMQASSMGAPVVLRGQECLFLETYNPTDPATHVTETQMTDGILQNGHLYQIVISGTASYWDPTVWYGPIGAPEPAPMFPSLAGNQTGLVGIDWEYLFGYPDPTFTLALPMHFTYGLISIDGGGVFSNPTPITGSDYRPSHTYTFVVVGQGQKAAFQRIDLGPSHDNYGRFNICVSQLVPDDPSCVRTQGYWGNKPGVVWPNPYSRTATFFLSGQTWQQVMDAPVNASTGYYQLAHQYIAAVLNQANGAAVPQGVQDVLNLAESWLGANGPSACTARGSCGDQKNWASILDTYNNGLYPGGPSHCN